MVIGLGAAGVTGAADGCAEASGWAGAAGWRRRHGLGGGRDADDQVLISSTLPMTPMVETGVFVPSPWTWPDGMVMLLAVEDADDLRHRDVRLGELGRVERDRDAAAPRRR